MDLTIDTETDLKTIAATPIIDTESDMKLTNATQPAH